MKKRIAMLFLAACVSVGAFAQGRKMDKISVEQRAEFRAKRMKEHLGLSDKQYQQVYELNLEQTKKRESLKKSHDFAEKREDFMAGRHEKYKEILTDEQMKKLKSLRENRPSAEKRAEFQTNRLKDEVGLSQEQYQKLYSYHLKEAQKRDSLHLAHRDKFKKEFEEADKKLEKILTPEQYKKFQEERADRVEHRGGRR